MSRGYNKAFSNRKGSVHASIQFDKLFNENTNRPSAVRSAGTVGKWGITSFTSIRSANGLGLIHREEVIPQKCVRTVSGDQNTRVSSGDPFAFESTTNNSVPVPKPKKFFKSRNPDPVDVSGIRSDAALYTKKTDYTYGAAKRSKLNHKEEPETKTVTRNSNKKVLCSKNTQSSSNVRVSILSPNSKRTDKPPIVLRISKGKSRLLSDSDEAPDPVPVPPKSPSHGRVTRSSCRNNSADAESHSDSNHDLIPSLFTSPRGGELQYIPAEKYELERKAIYENLLGGSSPISTVHKPSVEEVSSASTSQLEPQTDESTEDKGSEEITEPEQVEKIPVEVESVSESQEKVQENMDSDSDTPSENLPEQAPKSPQSMTEDKPEENAAPPVKLVISKKKGRVFKSRSLLVEGSKKRHALYKHKWCDDKDATSQKLGTDVPDNSKPSSGDAPVYEEMDLEGEQLTRVTHWPGESADLIDEPEIITSIKCAKKAKGFYTVVRNVKKAHQIQEIGEFQEFNDDVDYILDALQDNNPNSTRCLSAITLASKCMTPAFRMHLRAHGTVAKFFKALHDATKDQSLGLCTATVMFVLSQDRLNMDLDRDCLELMLNLLESDVSHRNALNDCGMSSAQLRKNKEKVRELCAEIQGQGHAMHLDLDNITVGHLAMETLLSLTSKRAGEWFKEELRELGGLEHIIKTICDCCNQIFENSKVWTDIILDKLRKVERCLRVLENVTHVNEENQTYILKYKNGVVVDTLVKLYRLCDSEMPSYPVTDLADKESTGVVIREAVLVTLKVLINLTHHFNSRSTGCALVGERPGIIDASLHLLLRVPNYIPEQKKFELSVLVLMLLINLIQHDDNNKKLLMDAKEPEGEDSIFPSNKTAVEALVDQFYSREQLARVAEQRTNAILDGDSTLNSAPENMSHEEFIGETMDKLIQKAGTHMEHTMIGSYIVLLLGYLIMNNKEYEEKVRMLIAPHNFTDMHTMLVKFFNFMYLTASGEAVSICHIKATEKVIKYLEKCDKEQPKENKSLDIDMELS